MSNEQRINRIRISLDVAADRRDTRWSGSALAIVAASSPAASLTVARPSTDGRLLHVGEGWSGEPFESLQLSWAAQPGEWVDVEWWGDGYTPIKFPGPSTIPLARSASIIAAATDGVDGTAYVAFGDASCNCLDVVNNSGADIEYRRNGAGSTIPIPAGSARLVVGISNADQISIRRVDQGTTSVTITAEALTA